MEKATSAEFAAVEPAQLIEKFQAGTWRYLRALGCDDSLADDLTQDTFVIVLQKPFEQYSDAATASYLRRVAHNLFISYQRRQSKVTVVEDLELFESCWIQWIRDDSGDELVDSLKRCMSLLTKRAMWAIKMRYRDQLSRKQIADNLEITEHGAKNLMQRAKQQLRNCIEGKIDG